ncbi:ATP-grasp peptide maturase system methyltransferase [Streptomyces sp. JB150]|uniref:ATP-grasp peptide maturase system methyltransferase n=1 Tax=Streptomyces sp. JB150 TaxID=2714844 RepID=UPI001408C776|nr:ATP-grasp peptide maturase system methyltransferase [Streptomyces sp. JB150]QIJ62939.1 methyltransferase [Streptomyces sp. JB150]
MLLPETAAHRRALADRLVAAGALRDPRWQAAVEAVPRELFLNPGVFLPAEGGRWRPVTALGVAAGEWLDIAYSDRSLATQLDCHLTADETADLVSGIPTSSSTTPMTVVGMLEDLEVSDGQRVLEIGTGTGYSTALLCHRLGEDNVTTVEVDPQVAARADAALEGAGFSTWTVTGDGLVGHPPRAPYDRVIATCAVRRIPYAWIRQTKPGGIILATVGSWSYGTGLAKVVVNEEGAAQGRIIGCSAFMHARSQSTALPADLSARTAYADTKRLAKLPPTVLDEWTPAFLAQLAAPGTQLVSARAVNSSQQLYLIDSNRESFATLAEDDTGGWVVRQGGPVALWDVIEQALIAWLDAGEPELSEVSLRISKACHTYTMGKGRTLRWDHYVQ